MLAAEEAASDATCTQHTLPSQHEDMLGLAGRTLCASGRQAFYLHLSGFVLDECPQRMHPAMSSSRELTANHLRDTRTHDSVYQTDISALPLQGAALR